MFRKQRERKRAQDEASRRQRIAALECAAGVCEHTVDGVHPRLVVSQYGKRY